MIGTKIFLVGLIVMFFAFVLAQLAGQEVNDKTKQFIGGIVLTGLIMVTVGGIVWTVMS